MRYALPLLLCLLVGCDSRDDVGPRVTGTYAAEVPDVFGTETFEVTFEMEEAPDGYVTGTYVQFDANGEFVDRQGIRGQHDHPDIELHFLEVEDVDFVGTVSDDGDVITGSFTSSPRSFTLRRE